MARAILISSVYGSGHGKYLEELIVCASSAADRVGYFEDVAGRSESDPRKTHNNSASFAAGYAARSVETAADNLKSTDHAVASVIEAASSAHSAARYDIEEFSLANYDASNPDLVRFDRPVWSGVNVSPAVTQNHKRFLSNLSADPQLWAFWHDWYLAMWNGTFEDWDLATEVALIPDADWEKGAEHIAALINDIERKLKTAVSTSLVETASGIWDTEPDLTIPSEPLTFAIAQVEVALMSALASGQGNGLTVTSSEAVGIRLACDKYGDQPSVVAATFWNACMSLNKNIGDLYPEDAALIALQNTLYTSVGVLCDQDALIEERIGKLAALETKKAPTSQDRKDLTELPSKVAENLTPQAQEELQQMIDIVVSSEKPPRIWRARLVNWVTVLGIGVDKAQKNEKRAQWLLGVGRRIGGWFSDE